MLKKFIDFSGSLIGLIVLSIPLLLIALTIRLKMGSPVIFKQVRPGLNAKPFTLYKFRTMKNLRNETGDLLPESQRITPFGQFLRKTSLDELPELINVLKGEMSLVGPRPLLMEYVPLYSKEQSKRHNIKPGITGWAQVKGRNAISWENKFELDVWYVNHQSLYLDLKIIFLTMAIVLKHEGIYLNEDMQMSPFAGSEEPEKKHISSFND